MLRDQALELFATHGLRKEAVHVTRLALGQGLVGTIAEEGRILNLAEAASHPEFVYRPETGEEHFHRFAGVPIVRGRRGAGHRSKRKRLAAESAARRDHLGTTKRRSKRRRRSANAEAIETLVSYRITVPQEEAA